MGDIHGDGPSSILGKEQNFIFGNVRFEMFASHLI